MQSTGCLLTMRAAWSRRQQWPRYRRETGYNVSRLTFSGSDLPGGLGGGWTPQRIFWPSQSMSVWASVGGVDSNPSSSYCHLLVHMARVILSWSKCLMADFFYRSSRFKLHDYDENSFLWISETGMFKWDDNMHAVLVNMILLELCQWFPALLLNN